MLSSTIISCIAQHFLSACINSFVPIIHLLKGYIIIGRVRFELCYTMSPLHGTTDYSRIITDRLPSYLPVAREQRRWCWTHCWLIYFEIRDVCVLIASARRSVNGLTITQLAPGLCIRSSMRRERNVVLCVFSAWEVWSCIGVERGPRGRART